MQPVTVTEGNSPIVLSIPHSGIFVPEQVSRRFTPVGRRLLDADWHVDRLYDGLLPHATVVRASFHRYVVDANRPPSGESLYPGQNTTGLTPQITFDGEPIWAEDGCREYQQWALQEFHVPYHKALRQHLQRVHQTHGVALLYDCHSIRSKIPFLFEGTLPDFNIGTAGGQSCDPCIEQAVAQLCANFPGRTSVVNGRFRGGWTTRHYGRPENGYHAIQMELSQSLYLEDSPGPFRYCEHKAAQLRPQLQEILESLEAFVLEM